MSIGFGGSVDVGGMDLSANVSIGLNGIDISFGNGNLDPATQRHFDVQIDDTILPTFTQVDGLSAEYEIEEIKQGGNNLYTHKLLGRLKYPNVKLTRAIDNQSNALAAWFAQSVAGAYGSGTAVITAYDGNGSSIASWTLAGAMPAKYTGPSFNATGTAVATESIELIHNGFLFSLGNQS